LYRLTLTNALIKSISQKLEDMHRKWRHTSSFRTCHAHISYNENEYGKFKDRKIQRIKSTVWKKSLSHSDIAVTSNHQTSETSVCKHQ